MTRPTTKIRATATASIAFGLVAIPVKLYAVVPESDAKDEGGAFHLLHASCAATGRADARLAQHYTCKVCDAPVPRSETVKGYTTPDGVTVTLTAEEMKALEAVSTHQIDVREFIPADRIDPSAIEKSYRLTPDRGGERAYRLLRDALTVRGAAAIASFASRGRSHLVAIRIDGPGLVMLRLHRPEATRDWSVVPLPMLPDVSAEEMGLALNLIDHVGVRMDLTPALYPDEVRVKTQAMIADKVATGCALRAPTAPAPQTTPTIPDLLGALRDSIAAAFAALGGRR